MGSEVNSTEHHAHHQGVTMECPASCLGVRTVADLVSILATTARTILPDAYPSDHLDDEPQKHDQHSSSCPLSCLNLSVRVNNALKPHRDEARTIGDLMRMIQSGELHDIRNIGRRSLTEIHTALVAAGIDVRHLRLT